MIKNINITLFSFFILLSGCTGGEKPLSISGLFPEPILLHSSTGAFVQKDSVALIEGLACSGNNLIVYDLHSGVSYTLFDAQTGGYITRFGKIGQGPGEISSGSYGSFFKDCFVVFDDATKKMTAFNMDSLRHGNNHDGFVWHKRYNIGDSRLSRLVLLDDSLFLGAGLSNQRYQYVLFDKENHIHDTAVEVYNSDDPSFDIYTRFLSNQNDLVTNRSGNRFACSLNFSSNIDFLEARGNKIQVVKSLRLRDPLYIPESSTNMYSASITPDSFWGYICLCSTDKHVYALYSEKKVSQVGRCSSTVPVYDWDGNPVRSLLLDTEVSHIAVDETGNRLFASVKDEDYYWNIKVYDLEE